MQHAYGSPVGSLGAGILCLFCAWGCDSESSAIVADAGVTANGGATFQLQPDAGEPGSAAGQGGAEGNDAGSGGETGEANGGTSSTEPDAAAPVVPDAGLSPERRACAEMCARQVVYNAATPCSGFAEALCFATCTSVTEYAPYLGCEAEHTELLNCQIAADTWVCQRSGLFDAGIENEIVADLAVCTAERAVLDACSPPLP